MTVFLQIVEIQISCLTFSNDSRIMEWETSKIRCCKSCKCAGLLIWWGQIIFLCDQSPFLDDADQVTVWFDRLNGMEHHLVESEDNFHLILPMIEQLTAEYHLLGVDWETDPTKLGIYSKASQACIFWGYWVWLSRTICEFSLSQWRKFCLLTCSFKNNVHPSVKQNLKK